MKIDINSDMGEGFGHWTVGDDAALMDIVSSANVACGFHAGDAVIMDRTVRMAKERNIAIGAHPGLPDLMGFGRRVIQMEAAELEKHLIYQIGALQAIAAAAGHRVTHVSYHAALGNMATADRDVADLLARAIKRIDRDLIVFSMPDTEVERASERAGLRTHTLFLADRAYDEHGNLVPRKKPNSVITSLDAVADRVRQFLDDGTVVSIEGKRLKVRARGILIHSDTPGSVELARTVRRVVESGGAKVTPAVEILS
ncbi:5-oxoprolinase subunit PxpA [Terrarubrum flagellatum]|uniref:LamB/YcsF family protein n=1 Tax=Terrirubrum flagellatum TaxID=2895980 RepID=UPI003144D69B